MIIITIALTISSSCNINNHNDTITPTVINNIVVLIKLLAAIIEATISPTININEIHYLTDKNNSSLNKSCILNNFKNNKSALIFL